MERNGRPEKVGARRKKIVLLGMMSNIPVSGVVWQTVHYLLGFRRLGYEVYYVEAHARTPTMFMETEECDGTGRAAAFIDRIMRRFDLAGRWTLHALHEDGRCHGLSGGELKRLYASADVIINLHGGTAPRPEHSAGGRLVYVETDPVQLQIELHDGVKETLDFLEPHCAFFTFGENYGRPGCGLPVSKLFEFKPTRQPVVLDLWRGVAGDASGDFTTIGNWRQEWREVHFDGEVYFWSKHLEFMKFLDLPSRVGESFELAMGSCDAEERRLLESKGWRMRSALDLSNDMDAYRRYIGGSRGEFTVAKDQNARLRSGWFSDRSATYLAAGRPVITQETGFDEILPTGEGLFSFSTMEEILEAVEEIGANHERHSRAASELAREYFDAETVLASLLAELGLPHSAARGETSMADPKNTAEPTDPFPPDMVLLPTSRRPTTLPEATVETVLAAPEPVSPTIYDVSKSVRAAKLASVVVVAFDNLVYTKLCLESLLANTERPSYEVIVVDNGSTDGTPGYLRSLARRHPNVRVVFNGGNLGFARASNRGLATASGDVLVLLNNDTVVPRGWLARLARHLEEPEIGAVGPVTNRIGNEAQIDVPYRTYGGFARFAREYTRAREGELFDIRMLAMFCLAMRRDVYERIGPLDERFEVGMLEDDDYAMRIHEAGYRVVCAEDVFVHHFGEASFGGLFANGTHGEILRANKERFREKWGRPWQPYERRHTDEYRELRERVLEFAGTVIPPRSTVAVASRGDNEMLGFECREAWHFPQSEDGGYAGHHPADSDAAIGELEATRRKGARFLVIPKTSFWWLEHYDGFARHLARRYATAARRDDTCVVFALEASAKGGLAK